MVPKEVDAIAFLFLLSSDFFEIRTFSNSSNLYDCSNW